LSALGREGAVYALGNVLSRLGGFILLPLYLSVLTPSEYGVLEMFYTTSALLAVFISGGLAQATLRFYFEYQDEGDRRAVITTAIAAAAGFSGITAAVLWSFAEPASALLVGTPYYASSLQIILLTLVVQLTSEVGLNFLRVKNYAWQYVIASSGQLVLQVVINIITVAKLHWGVPGVLLGNLLGAAASGTVVVWMAIAECGLACSTTKLIKMLRYTWPMVVAGIAAVVLSRADRFILQNMLGLEAVGIYALAEKLAMIFAVGFLQPFRLAYGAYRFAIIRDADRASLQRQVLRFYLIVACLLGLVTVVSIPPLLKLVSREAYWSAAGLLPILILRNVMSGAEYVFQTGLLYAKQTRYVMVIQVASGVLRIAVTLALVGAIGVTAPAYAALLGMSVAAIASMFVSRRYDPVDWDLVAIGKIMVITVACLALVEIANGRVITTMSIVFVFLGSGVLAKVLSGAEMRAAFRAAADWVRRQRSGTAGDP